MVLAKINYTMKLVLIIAVLGFSACSPKWQKEFTKKSVPFISSDSTLNKLTNESSVVLIQDLVRPHELGYTRYNIVYRQNKQWYTLNYQNEGNLKMTKEKISKSKGDSILNVFVVNRFWNINKANASVCQYGVIDGGNEKLVMVINKKSVKIDLNAPAILESKCPGNKDRLAFLMCRDALQANN